MQQYKIHLDKTELAYKHVLNSNESKQINQVVACKLLHLKSNQMYDHDFKYVHYHSIF